MIDTTETFNPPVFNEFGTLADRCSDADLARIEPTRRKFYERVFITRDERVAVETSLKEHKAQLRQFEKDHREATRRVAQYRPPRSFLDEWKIATGKPIDPPDPEIIALADAAQSEADALTLQIGAMQGTLNFEQAALKDAQKREGAALADYIDRYVRVSQSQALHDHAQAEARRRAQNVSEGRRAEQNRAPQTVHHSSVLDAVRSGGKGPAGFSNKVGMRPNSFPASARGQVVPSKRPGEP